ncbi:hypothetical protein VNO77_05613 [Canavalia gladiata]|uniref:UBC core domain-containing protein n=1 Tax=Canavalia gladiata TaxID=3824 RepID=A0AAN9RA67_CANGL
MEEMNAFEHFDVVSDDSDHYFVRSSDGKCFSDSKSGVYKTIMREWRTLEQNLPDSIYVRVYERRIDLMRVVIVGAAGTPYQDGLFFFDIAFPSDYPNNPPMLYFNSFGIRLNPNLYANARMKVKYPVVVEAFQQNGASLECFVQQLELQRKQTKTATKVTNPKTNGIFKKVMEKIKRALRWKNGEKKEKKHRIHKSV